MIDSTDDVIRSPDNRTLKLIRSLRQRKMRDSERAFVLEGIRAVEDALEIGGPARVILVRADSDWRPSPRSAAVPVRRVAPRLFNELAETESPQPVMAVFDIPEMMPAERDSPLYVVVDGVQDPGNLGTLLRSASAVDASAVLLTPGTVDAYNGKVVRAAMGAHFRLPIAPLDETSREWLVDRCAVRVLAEMRSALTYDRIDWTEPVALIVGSEAHGPSEIGRSLATVSAGIPLLNDVESLNAGVAASVMLFEAARQRRALIYA
jgi:TrmH family RNA methyltransferase